MADGSDTTLILADMPALVASIKEFAAEHSGTKAVIEYLGRRGARIVLVGADGAGWGDLVTPSIETARAACEQAGVTVDNGWERELVELMRPSNDLWRSMARRKLAR
jgi:hypothetical protein